MIYILSGPPCSGKSTYAKKHLSHIPRLNKDSLRAMLGFKKYNHKKESLVHYLLLKGVDVFQDDVVVDNTHTSLKYFIDFYSYSPVTVILFITSYWKQRLRNFKRYLFTGFWIPKKVAKRMNKNFSKLQEKLELLPKHWIILKIKT